MTGHCTWYLMILSTSPFWKHGARPFVLVVVRRAPNTRKLQVDGQRNPCPVCPEKAPKPLFFFSLVLFFFAEWRTRENEAHARALPSLPHVPPAAARLASEKSRRLRRLALAPREGGEERAKGIGITCLWVCGGAGSTEPRRPKSKRNDLRG